MSELDLNQIEELASNLRAVSDETYSAAVAVADVYNATSSYDIGDYCIKSTLLYKCNTAIPSGEVWNSNHWDEICVSDELNEIRSGAMHWDLLWENASPTSEFSAQTINLDLTNYQFVLIGFNGWNDDATVTSQIIKKGDNAAHVEFRNAQNASTCAVFQRNITVSNSGVVFDNCSGKADITVATVGAALTGLVPAIIYGIKGADI